MIIPAQTLRLIRPVEPFVERGVIRGRSYGLSSAGYDIRVDQDIRLWPGQFSLGSTVERFSMPNDLLAIVHDKSSWARLGLSVFNTVVEPGWSGYLTIELSNRGERAIEIIQGDPIAQMVFHRLEAPTENEYRGKYQNQPRGPQPAMYESDQ